MKLYVARHGETDADLSPAVGGRFVASLNETGRMQARKLAEQLKGTDISVIYTSPLIQAVKTAEAVNKYHNVYIQKQFSLNEIETGTLHGHSKRSSAYDVCHTSVFHRFPEGESNADVIARVYPFLDMLKEQNIYDADVLIITHGSICRVIETYFSDEADSTFGADEWKNCEVREYELKKEVNGQFTSE